MFEGFTMRAWVVRSVALVAVGSSTGCLTRYGWARALQGRGELVEAESIRSAGVDEEDAVHFGVLFGDGTTEYLSTTAHQAHGELSLSRGDLSVTFRDYRSVTVLPEDALRSVCEDCFRRRVDSALCEGGVLIWLERSEGKSVLVLLDPGTTPHPPGAARALLTAAIRRMTIESRRSSSIGDAWRGTPGWLMVDLSVAPGLTLAFVAMLPFLLLKRLTTPQS
jgi:hypothetical protein